MKVIKGKGVSKTARASMYTAPVAEKVVLTPEQAIQEIRNLRAGKLSVGNMEYVDRLLAEYDRARAVIADALEYLNAHSKYETLVDLQAGLQVVIASLETEVALQDDQIDSLRNECDKLRAELVCQQPYIPATTSAIGSDEIIG